MAAPPDDPLENVLDRTIEETDGDEVCFGDVLDLFGHRSFGPVVTLLGLLTLIPPLGGIPGLPVVIGLMIILFSAQIVFGADHIWVPGFLEKRSISKDRLKTANEKARSWLKRFDNMVSERLTFLTGHISIYIAAVCVTVMALLMIPLELVPMVVGVPGTAVVLFGLGFTARDGVLMLLAYAVSIAATVMTIMVVPWGIFFSMFSGGGG